MYINNTAGGLVLGANAVTATTKFDVIGLGTTTGNTLRLANSSNVSRFRFLDAGTMFVDVAPSNDNALTQILARDGATGEVKYRTAASLSGSGTFTISEAEIDFGVVEEYDTSVFVSDTSITGTSKIIVSVSATATTEHTIDDITSTVIIVFAGNVQNGVGFTIYAKAPEGTYGKYKVNYSIQY